MSVIIPNMKMPMSCMTCPLAREMFGCLVCVGYFKDNLTGRRVYKIDLKESDTDFNRPDWCPLVPLPEGHGDLIDRDNVLLDIDCIGTNKFGMLDEDIRAFLRRYTPIVPAEGGGEECAAKLDKFGLGDPGPRNADVCLAYRTIRDYCRLRECDSSCYLYKFCGVNGPFSMTSPRFWPDQEGGGEDGN